MEISIAESSDVSDATDTSPDIRRQSQLKCNFNKLRIHKTPSYPQTEGSIDCDDFEDIKEILELIEIKTVKNANKKLEEHSSHFPVLSPRSHRKEFLIRKKSQPLSPRLIKTTRNK